MSIVMKFGGTSVADGERIGHAASLAREAARTHEVVVVVSALDGVTEQLLELAEAAVSNRRSGVLALLGTLRQAHERAAEAVASRAPGGGGSGGGGGGATAGDVRGAVDHLLGQLETLTNGIAALGELTPRSLDAVVAFGERLSTAIFAAALGAPGYDGRAAGIVTNDHFGEADPLMDLSMFQVKQTLGPVLGRGRPVVVSGFIAANQHGITTTLGRGGSDYTATILGAALRAEEIWIWSDVDGLMTADPRIVPTARLLGRISFAEAVEMGKFGAKSMHPRALEPAAAHGIPVRMRNTFRPEGSGTLIAATPGPEAGAARGAEQAVRSVPMLKKTAFLTAGGAGMIGKPGTAAAIFGALAEARVNVHMICQSVSEAGISVAVAGAQADRARAALERALHAVLGPVGERGEAGDIASRVDALEGVSIVAAVGAGMRGTPGVAGRLFTAVARRGVNVIAIAQGSSERSIAFAVTDAQGPEAVRAVHDEFEPGG